MAATFRPVNSSFSAESTTDTTPSSSTLRPSTAEGNMAPTRTSFAAPAAGQKPLPGSPFAKPPQAPESTENASRRDSSHRSAKSPARNSMDVDMEGSDGETGTVEEENQGSDDESVNADGSRSSKKKKSQRFYCTDYPPCNLSFTRSEHLARHIRKHTGERPFQCHCSRRFSRLDNLRQHAQTVHVNEDIPSDSLAASGSRFQRQLRTDRVRQAGNRARASTGGSAGGPPRGHSKSLSTSSISSIASMGSAYGPLDPRRRPTPLVMAADPRSRLPLESYRSNAEGTFSYRPQSPGDFTPTSGAFSTAQSSPQWGPEVAPSSSHSRSQSMYIVPSRPVSRRLSVPSGPHPFQPGPSQLPGRSTLGSVFMNTSNAGAFPSPPSSGLISSPVVSNADWAARRDSTASAGDEGWRRRTWHPDSRGFNGHPAHLNSVMSQAVRPNPPPPIANPTKPVSTLRLPGIESFDPILPRSGTPPAHYTVEHMTQRPTQMESLQADERRNLNMYDVSLQRGLNRLDLGHKTPPRDGAGAWASDANKAVLAQAERIQANPPPVRFEEQRPSHQVLASGMPGRTFHQHTMSAPNLAHARESRRHGWYHGPPAVQAESGQQPYQEARGPHVDRIIHPNFNGFAGFPARDQPPQMQQQQRSNNPDPLRRLEALVAVATSEGTKATAY